MAERGEAQARAERNYKRKRAALAEVARRRAAEDCGGGALSEPMDEAEEDASRRESASKVGSPGMVAALALGPGQILTYA